MSAFNHINTVKEAILNQAKLVHG